MKSKSLILACLVLTCHVALTAQIEPTSTVDLGVDCHQIYVLESTRVPVFETKSEYVGVDPRTHEIIWKSSRSGIAQTTEFAGVDAADLVELPSSLLAYVGNSILNVTNGDVVVDGDKDEVRSLSDLALFPSVDLLTVKLSTKSGARLYGINPIESSVLWTLQLDESSGLSQMMQESADEGTAGIRNFRPYIAENDNLIMKHKKTLLCINPQDGQEVWKIKTDPGEVLFSPDKKYFALAQNRSIGITSTSSGSAAPTEPKLSKKLEVFEAQSGKSVWGKNIKLDGQIAFLKPYDGGFMVVHGSGVNIYDFESSKPRWKNDYKSKGIYDVISEEENFMVYFKSKKMLITKSDGSAVWKKAEKLENAPRRFLGIAIPVQERGRYSILEGASGITIVNHELKKRRGCPSFTYLEDTEADAIVSLAYDDREGSTIPPSWRFSYIDLETMKMSKKYLPQKIGLNTIDKVENGYFVFGPRGFQLVELVEGKVQVIKKEHFPMPGSFTRGLARFGVGLATLGAATSNSRNYVVGKDAGDFDKFESRMNASGAASETSRNFFTLEERSSVQNRFAYFFGRDDDRELSLFQIEKNTGEEFERYIFEDKTPIYETDMVFSQLYYITDDKKLKVYELKQ